MDNKKRFQELIGVTTKEDRLQMISENFINLKDEAPKKIEQDEEPCDDEELDIDFDNEDEL